MGEILKFLFSRYRHTSICAGILLALSIFGCMMIVLRWIYTGKPTFAYLIWNLFLAWLPFGFSILISYIITSVRMRGKTATVFMLGIMWLLFYPNAPYIITDFIHFRDYGAFLVWFDLAIFSIFAFTGLLLGFVSMYSINRVIERHTNKITGWVFVLIVQFLSSYGIYLGRFIRWNSWDILMNPLDLIHSVIENVDVWSISFSIAYGVMLTLIYAFLYGLTYLKQEKIF